MVAKERNLTCIVCPRGCSLKATVDDGVVINVSGNLCPRGKRYAAEEITAPKRQLTSTVRIENGSLALLPVVSSASLPKDSILACAEFLRSVEVKAPIAEGQVICSNILNLGVDIIASRSMEAMLEKN
ncbi:MAG TPA: DUF1667 domain-containing protein [Candidatus Avacidaminococcus intestinavium]|uniref:DUF1667 domain-containing protein n=1 Tax=Candidatus Avacidaminococcus intestinavium TaxID=2840684 RepID=A0A9D1MQV7_9FIRM|nr:DUF1667 domain-containing protein [Candidatus Avacidaminococcus intestinavium]